MKFLSLVLAFVASTTLIQADKLHDKCVAIEDSTCWPDENLFRSLDERLDGNIVLPSDKNWKKAIKLKNPRLKIVPGAVVMAKSTSDVIAAVKVRQASLGESL